MKRKFLCMALSALLTTAALCGCDTAGSGSPNGGSEAKEPLTVWTATDIHYLSPSLTDNGELFQRVMADGDAKLTEYSEEIADEFIEEVIAAKPDALVITGDITFNGEIVSLREIAEKFRKVKDAGVPVLFLPGNHDIESYRAFTYSGSEVEYTENISKEEFREICWDFGPKDAISVADDSFSYVYVVTDDTWIMTIDANTKGAGRVTDETLAWAEEQLDKAQKDGITVITATHQSVIAQNSRMVFGYIISNHEDVAKMLISHGVRLNLSGHIHMQHTAYADADGNVIRGGSEGAEKTAVLTDIATGSMSVAALRYGIVELDEERNFTYTMESVGTMREEAKERFDLRTHAQALEQIENTDASPAEKEKMAEFLEDINYKFFTGVLPKDYLEGQEQSEGLDLWRRYGQGTFLLEYIESMPEQ